jgi:hypothetical protein
MSRSAGLGPGAGAGLSEGNAPRAHWNVGHWTVQYDSGVVQDRPTPQFRRDFFAWKEGAPPEARTLLNTAHLHA